MESHLAPKTLSLATILLTTVLAGSLCGPVFLRSNSDGHLANPLPIVQQSLAGEAELGIDCGYGSNEAIYNATGYPGPDGTASTGNAGSPTLDSSCTWAGLPDIAAGGTQYQPLVSDNPTATVGPSCCATPSRGGGFTAEIVLVQNSTTVVNGYDITVSWNPLVLNAVEFDQTGLPFFGDKSFTVTSVIDNTAGSAEVATALLSPPAPSATLSGNVTLFRIRFDVVGIGKTPLTISNDLVIDPLVFPNHIHHTTVQGNFDSTGIPDGIAGATLGFNLNFTFSPIPPVPGSPLNLTGHASCAGCNGVLSFYWDTDSIQGYPDPTAPPPTVEATSDMATIIAPTATHRVTLIVNDTAGHVAQATRRLLVSTTSGPLAVTLHCPSTGTVGTVISCTASPTGGTPPYTLAWIAGHGSPETGNNSSSFSTTFSTTGTKLIRVSSTDITSQIAFAFAEVRINSPTVSVKINCPATGTVGSALSCSASSPDGNVPITFSWTATGGSPFVGSGPSFTTTYRTIGTHAIRVTMTDSASLSATDSAIITINSSPSAPAGYLLSWQGYDWDGGHEETVYLNGNVLARLPLTEVVGNGGSWAPFSLNITSLLVQRTNLLTFAHAGWDCGISDNVTSLLITSGSNVVYSNPVSLPLSCAQSLTYTFSIGTAPPPPPPPPLSLSESFDTANPIVGQTCSFGGLASGGTPPFSFSWDFGDNSTGFGRSITHIYSAPGKYAVILTVRDSASPSSNTLSVTGYQIVSSPPPPSNGTYTLSWQGFDWDGAGEETITLNGQVFTALPGADTPSNGGAWAPFSLNVTSYIVNGTNALTFTHANWDCSISDNVRNLEITYGTTEIYSNPNESQLSCTQTLTYTFGTNV